MRSLLVALCLSLATAASAQGLDATSIRRQADEIAKLKTLLADPDANVRLLTMQQAVLSPDPAVRTLAIETGLASNEIDLVNVALRGTLVGRTAVLITYEPPTPINRRRTARNDQSSEAGDTATLILTINSFDAKTGQISGVSTCPASGRGDWTGAVRGSSLSFITERNQCHGRLDWNAEANAFKGVVTVSRYPAGANRPANWNPN